MTINVVASSKEVKTMNTNQIFNWKRFTAALRKEIAENWRLLALVLLVLYLTLTIVFTIANIYDYSYRSYGSVFKNDPQLLKKFLIEMIIAVAWSVVTAIMASMAFRHLTSKKGRIDLFTLPVSTTEKYAVNLTVYVIGAFVALIVIGYLADLTRYAILSLTGFSGTEITPPVDILYHWLKGESGSLFFEQGFYPDNNYLAFVALFVAPAIYFLGSVLWPKWSLVKSYIALQVINYVILGIALLAFSVPLERGLDFGEAALYGKGFDVLTVTNCISLTLALIAWFGSWYLFKHKDIVSPKWWK